MELTLGSMSTLSFSFRDTVSGFSSTSGVFPDSTSGTLWRSAVCEAKLLSVIAAVREDRTHLRYGRSDWDCGGAVLVSCGFEFGGPGRGVELTIMIRSWGAGESAVEGELCATSCVRLGNPNPLPHQKG